MPSPPLGPDFKLTAVTRGTAGNGIVIAVVVAGDNTPFSIVTVGNMITINLATDSGGASLTTALAAAEAINADPEASLLVSAVGPDAIITVSSSCATSGGAGGEGTSGQLVDLGVIVRDASYKAYSNNYVPVGLLWPFLSAEAPGWLYPEIYIPRLGQIYFDFDYLVPGFAPAASPVTITLGLKGMKAYPQNG